MRDSFDLCGALALFAGVVLASPIAAAQSCPACEQATVVQAGDTPFVGSATGCFIPASEAACPLPSNLSLIHI